MTRPEIKHQLKRALSGLTMNPIWEIRDRLVRMRAARERAVAIRRTAQKV